MSSSSVDAGAVRYPRIYPGAALDSHTVLPAGSDRLSPLMSLREFFERYVLKILLRRSAAPANIQQYRESLRLWDFYTACPSLRQIGFDPDIAARFGEMLQARRWRGRALSPNTMRKHLGAIQFCLDLAGPRVDGLMGPGRKTNESKARRDGLFGVDERGRPRPTPYLAKPPLRSKPAEDCFTIQEISRWLEACTRATVPAGLPIAASQWWIGLVWWNYNVGTRIGTTLQLRWEMLRGDTLHVPATIEVDGVTIKVLKGSNDQQFHVNPETRRVVEAIRTDDPRIFPWPHCISYLHTIRRQLLAAAGIPKERQFGFHGGRKALCTELMEINPMAAQKALGHLGIAMSRDHYTSTRIVAKAMRKIPQPKLPNQEQLWLF